jgi:hypothetical protein
MTRATLGSWADEIFPNLQPSDYEITSPKTPSYNCIGWAAGEMYRWWEPDQYKTYYWPPTVKREYTVQAYIDAFRSIGYQPCGSAKYEEGHEKIALYCDEDGPTHAARQLKCGQWTSKLGPDEDIEHLTLECLKGGDYGEPVFYLVRKVSAT